MVLGAGKDQDEVEDEGGDGLRRSTLRRSTDRLSYPLRFAKFSCNPQPETDLRVTSVPFVISSMLKKVKSDLSNGDCGTTEPDILLEILFEKMQKLEMMSRDSQLAEDAEQGLNLEILETDVEQKQMEEELNKAHDDLIFQFRQIEELKIVVEAQGNEITRSQALLFQKGHELGELQKGVIKKDEEARLLRSELEFRDQIIWEANSLIKDQETKIKDYQKEVEEKEQDLSNSLELRKAEEERLEVMEAELEKKTLERSLAMDELRKRTDAASKDISDMKEASGDFMRVKSLLAAVRSELVPSQESLSSSRKEMTDETLQFEKQAAELSEQKLLLESNQSLETELELVKESLIKKEIELLASQRALVVKEEKFTEVLRKLEIREKEMENMKKLMEDASGLVERYCLAQETNGDPSLGALPIEELQLKAVMLEAEATTSALQKLADMTHELMKETEQMFDNSAMSSNRRIEDLNEAKKVVSLFALTEKLVTVAGILLACNVTFHHCMDGVNYKLDDKGFLSTIHINPQCGRC
ncbi:hypothetical protein MUK42_34281, partial [Musa troglodytarum]